VAAKIHTIVELHQRHVEMAFFSGFVGLKLGFEPLVSLDPFRGVAPGLNQCIGIAALTVVAFAQGFEKCSRAVLIGCVQQ